MITPQQLDEVTFAKALFGGYDMASVDEFLEPFTEDYITLYKENALLKNKMRVLVEKLEQYRQNEASLREAIANAQKTCDQMVKEAEAKCAEMLNNASANSEANRAADQSAEIALQVEQAKRSATEVIDKIQDQMNAAVRAMADMKTYIQTLEQERVANNFRAQQKLAGKTGITGRASEERPWMKFYPPGIENMLQLPQMTLNQYLHATCCGEELSVIHYYDREITWKEFFQMVDETARALRAAGVKEGDQLPVMLQAVPEFLIVLLAAEKVGAALLCRDNTIEENAEAVEKAGAKIMIVHDYITNEEVAAYITAGVERIITVSPQNLAGKMPDYVRKNLNTRYTSDQAVGGILEPWNDFLAKGKIFNGKVEADIDLDRPVYCCYTSGSTGTSKQVIHSAKTMLGVVCQMSGYGNSDDFRPTWLVTGLPPALVAVVVSMLLVPMASNRLLILDPFVDVYDIDLELMHYKPNNFPLIPMFMEILMHSDRIPEDYDMSHLLACGAGAEASNNGQIKRAQAFLEKHNCHVVFSTSYGQSEACSNITFPAPGVPFGNGNVGIPMPLNNMGVFRGTKECEYNKLGEICVTGPGVMLGYDNEEATKVALVRHDDGELWLHTGDTGYVTEDGVFYTLGRGLAKRWNEDKEKQGRLVDIQMENLLSDANIPGLNDCFFVTRPDHEHAGFFVPYLYAVLDEGFTIDEIRPYVEAALEEFQRPVEIIQIPERPFYHFKTNRLHLPAPYAR